MYNISITKMKSVTVGRIFVKFVSIIPVYSNRDNFDTTNNVLTSMTNSLQLRQRGSFIFHSNVYILCLHLYEFYLFIYMCASSNE